MLERRTIKLQAVKAVKECGPGCQAAPVDYEYSLDMDTIEMPRVARETTCGHKKHYAKGLCKSCYQKTLDYDKLAVQTKYNNSENGKARLKAYDQSEAGKRRKREWIAKRREEQRRLKEQQSNTSSSEVKPETGLDKSA